jgi:hypothetical protein
MLRDLLRSTTPRSFVRFAGRLGARLNKTLIRGTTRYDNPPAIMYRPEQRGAPAQAGSAQYPYFIAVDFAPAEVRGILDTTDFDLFEFHSPTVGWRHLPPPPPPPRAAVKSVWGAPPSAATIASHLPVGLVQNSGYHMTLCAMKRPGDYDVPFEQLEPLFHRNVAHGTIVARSVVITDAIAAVQLEIVTDAATILAPPGPGSTAAAGMAAVDAATLAAAAFNRHPHVTLALDRRRGVKPAFSNTMLELLENAVCAAAEQQSPAAAASPADSVASTSASDPSPTISRTSGPVATPPRAYAHHTHLNGGARFACAVSPAREQMPLFEPLRVAVLRSPVVLKSGIVVPH